MFGGYAVAAIWAAALARVLPMRAIDATIVATMMSFIVYALSAVWVFAARTTRRAAGGLILSAGVAALMHVGAA